MGALKKSGGGVNGGMEKGSMVALKRVNGGIEKGQWGRWSGSMGALRRVRSDRGLAVGQTGVWRQEVVLQGCKLYLTGLQALHYRVVSSALQGCKLYLVGL